MEAILIPPGRTQLWKCATGSQPLVKKGDILKSQDKAALYVVDVGAEGIVLGPLTAGDLEVAEICSGQGPLSFRIEAPDPSKVDKKVQPLSPVGMSYPWWLWLVALLAVALVTGAVLLVRRLLAPSKEASLRFSRTRLRKSPSEKMEVFLSKVDQQKLAEKDDAASSQLLYGEGLKRLRALLQEAYGFRAPGATTTEFVSELKAQALRKPSLIAAPQLARLESAFMQAKQVTYAREIPDADLRRSYLKSLRDFSEHLSSKIAEAKASTQAPARKTLFKRKGAS